MVVKTRASQNMGREPKWGCEV